MTYLMLIYNIVPFPDGFGATVHFFWPGKGSQVLGMCAYLSSTECKIVELTCEYQALER